VGEASDELAVPGVEEAPGAPAVPRVVGASDAPEVLAVAEVPDEPVVQGVGEAPREFAAQGVEEAPREFAAQGVVEQPSGVADVLGVQDAEESRAAAVYEPVVLVALAGVDRPEVARTAGEPAEVLACFQEVEWPVFLGAGSAPALLARPVVPLESRPLVGAPQEPCTVWRAGGKLPVPPAAFDHPALQIAHDRWKLGAHAEPERLRAASAGHAPPPTPEASAEH